MCFFYYKLYLIELMFFILNIKDYYYYYYYTQLIYVILYLFYFFLIKNKIDLNILIKIKYNEKYKIKT